MESNDPGVLAWARATFPTGIDGVPVVIRECHPPVLQARIGACLSHADNRANFGTLGCFLRRDDQIFALTAAHVVTLGADMVKVGAEVVSPSHARSFLLKQAQLLGTIEQMASDQDACLIGLTPEQSARARNDIPRRKGPKPLRCLAGNGLSKSAGKDGTVIWDDGWAVVGLRVAKVGAAKGNYRVGHVHKVKQDISFTDGATLKGLFTVRSGDGRVFSEGGDSGSVVFEDSGRRPVGLLLGGNGAESVCAEFNDILYTLDADLM
ncbi:hypothetical protein M2352_000869 [Azospirillum fermentarium]|uniref:S1 family peptidase n=1 Tax=Azospirillum fermentarium TaxID=1233114 RepID=UPI0022262F18|nr:S1 family peptidase [Azospirillum fermentarium]MCW2245278.1 hypothetical protein [Azospirillum fermentarium]